MQSALAICLSALHLLACSSQDDLEPPSAPTMLGNWKFRSYQVTQCDDPAGNSEETCNDSATICGVLTLTENTWTWSQTKSDGSHYFETGSYTMSTNYIILTGGSAAPGTILSPISGSTVSYTKTTLVFTNSSVTTGCVFKVSFARHAQPFIPLG